MVWSNVNIGVTSNYRLYFSGHHAPQFKIRLDRRGGITAKENSKTARNRHQCKQTEHRPVHFRIHDIYFRN